MKRSKTREQMRLVVTNERIQKESRAENALLLFVLEGEIRLSVDHVTGLLRQEKIALVNPHQVVSYEADGDILLAKIPVLYDFISAEACGFRVHFLRNPDSAELVSIVKDMLTGSEYNINNKKIYEYDAAYFRMLGCLIDHCIDTKTAEPDGRGDDRKNSILEYIHRNYSRQIGLADLSGYFHLSEGYLSHYFTKNIGMGFSQYLMRVRLQHIYDELLYSDKPITEISYDNGFFSISLFNRSFRRMYGQTPSEVRRHSQHPDSENTEKEEEIKTQVANYLEKSSPEKKTDEELIRISAAALGEPDRPCWRIINVGSASSLYSSALQSHIRMLHDAAGFRYARFWGLFSEDIFLRETEGWKVNYSKLERVFDFILSAGLKPFIDLEEKPERINQDTHRTVRFVKSGVVFESRLAWERTFTGLLSHLVTRYGAEEMSGWKIEVGQYRYYPSSLDDEAYYFEMFEFVCRAVKTAVPGLETGGCIASEQLALGDKPDVFLNHWHSREIKPDFLTFMFFAYDTDPQNWLKYSERSRDSQAIRKMVEYVRNKIAWAGFNSDSLVLSEWNITVSERNLMNATAFKGAYVLNTVLGLYDTVRAMGYYMASDQNAEHFDSADFLFGGNGLVTKDAILKPAAYAFVFLNQLYPAVLTRGDWYIATSNGRNKYRILCHNLVMPNYKYYMTEEDKLDIRKMNSYFDETEPVQREFELTDVPSGKYRVRIQRVNPVYGSVLQAWREFGFVRNMSLNDIQYLQKVIGPKMELCEKESSGMVLKLGLRMEANEMALISVDYFE